MQEWLYVRTGVDSLMFLKLASILLLQPSQFNEVAASIQVTMLEKHPANTTEAMRQRWVSTMRAAPDTSSSRREITTRNRRHAVRGLVLPPTIARDVERWPFV